jgi:hypothetical protein
LFAKLPTSKSSNPNDQQKLILWIGDSAGSVDLQYVD